MINEKHGHGTHSTKMGADKLAENTPNVPKKISLGVRSESKLDALKKFVSKLYTEYAFNYAL